MTEYVTLTRAHAQALLVEIAELRAQVSDLTRDRDFCRKKWEQREAELDALRVEREVEVE